MIRYWRSYFRDSVGAAVYASIRLWFWLRRRSFPRTCPVPGICRSASPPWEVSKFSSPSRPSRLWRQARVSRLRKAVLRLNTTRAGSERTSSSESSAAAVAAAAIRLGGYLQRDVIISYKMLLYTVAYELYGKDRRTRSPVAVVIVNLLLLLSARDENPTPVGQCSSTVFFVRERFEFDRGIREIREFLLYRTDATGSVYYFGAIKIMLGGGGHIKKTN